MPTDRAALLRSPQIVQRFSSDLINYQLKNPVDQGYEQPSITVIDWILLDIQNGSTAGILTYSLNYVTGILSPTTGVDYQDPNIYSFSYSLNANEADTFFLNFQPGGLPLFLKSTIIDTLTSSASYMSRIAGYLPSGAVQASISVPSGTTWTHIAYHFERPEARKIQYKGEGT